MLYFFTLPKCATRRVNFNLYFSTSKTCWYATTRVVVTYFEKQYFGSKSSCIPVCVALAGQILRPIFSLVRPFITYYFLIQEQRLCWQWIPFHYSCCSDCSAQLGAHHLLGRSSLFLYARTSGPCSYRNCHILGRWPRLASLEEHHCNFICVVSSNHRQLCQYTRNNCRILRITLLLRSRIFS